MGSGPGDDRRRELESQLAELRPRIVAAVAAACPPRLAADAEDVVQEVLARLADKLKQAEGKRSFNSMYLRKAAYGVAVDEIRRRCRRKEETGHDDGVLDGASTDADPARLVAGREIGAGIRDCLTRLVLPRRLAVLLHLQGCSGAEVAQRKGWSAKRAENLTYRGLADLRDCLRKKGMEP